MNSGMNTSRPKADKEIDARREVTRARVEQALRELPPAEADVVSAAAELLDSVIVLHPDRPLIPESAFFDFHGRITAIVRHFAARGLIMEMYLRACVVRPQLFAQAPATVIRHIEAVAAHFAGHGLTVDAYLRAALKRPSLLTFAPATIIGHVEALLNRFRGDGLEPRATLRLRCERRPSSTSRRRPWPPTSRVWSGISPRPA